MGKLAKKSDAAMTIENFDWDDFWASAWSASWCEIGALVALALLWRRLRTGKMGNDAKNDVRALFLLSAAFALAALCKLFNDLDVVALFWAALALGTALDYWKTRSRRRRELREAELKRRKKEAARRREFLGESVSSDGSSRRRHSRRSRPSSGSSRSQGERDSSRRREEGSGE